MNKKILGIIFILLIIIVGVSVYAIINNVESSQQLLDEYDVIVVGGEPEGVAAAVSAARNGAKTLLIENREELGGLFTYGMLNFLDIPQGEDGHSVSKGIFEEWHNLVGNTSVFDIELAKSTFRKMVEDEPNITLLTETNVLNSIKAGNKVVAIDIENETGQYTIKGKAFIDATQDADFAVMADAPYFVGGQDINIADKKMAVTLMIHLKNVDWEGIREAAKSEKFGEAVVTNTAAWGFASLHRAYPAKVENTRLRGLNLGKVGDDYYINALQIFGADGLSEESKKDGIERGKQETENILAYLQKEFPGFENAEIASFPTELYVRETRHILAEYQLPMSDLWTNSDHWDSIGFGAYPVDIQAQTPQDYGFVVAAPKQYAIPFRSLVPKEVDGLLVVGRAAGYSSIAAGSARIVPTGMVTGEAAGVAATIAINENLSFRELSKDQELIEQLRSKLKAQGAFVDHIETSYPYEGEWYDSSIQTLMDYGLILGSYTNDLKVDESTTQQYYVKLIHDSILRGNPEVFETYQESIIQVHDEILNLEDVPLVRDDAATILSRMLLLSTENISWQDLIDEGIIDEELAQRVLEDRELKLQEVYAIAVAVIQWNQ
ncbi:FAD-dependent oxidoreductase [Ureibacillus manganicus]|uniref:Uncharacterized protein n=1 Tax=Ureibacillus manganicus DSM 26584 TaxID=1384049 RepID=A0A0A3IBD7_9BACL|nr:FAD-dependent oxidoreductase [Ureibacillus manganicus]KGR80128.1 hypothetical protein CD29_01855 [Ureibacillus manganicus DSM 26584]